MNYCLFSTTFFYLNAIRNDHNNNLVAFEMGKLTKWIKIKGFYFTEQHKAGEILLKLF